jgi:hypothetical protein
MKTSVGASEQYYPRLILSIFFAAIGMVALTWLLSRIAPQVLESDRLRIVDSMLVSDPRLIKPEPNERFAFVALCFIFPGIVVASLWTASRFGTLSKAVLQIGSVGALAVVLVATVFSRDMTSELRISWLVAGIAALCLIGMIAVGRRSNGIPKWTAFSLIAVAFCLSVPWRLISIGGLPAEQMWPWHLDAIYYSVVFIGGGGTCLVDIIPQYGCYGEILAPIWRMLGGTVLAFSILMAVLQLGALALTAWFASKILQSRLALLTAALWLLICCNRLFYVDAEPYFQYDPLRLLFPAVSLPLAAWWLQESTLPKAAAMGLFGAVATLWNFDSGAPVFVALLALIAFTDGTRLSQRAIEIITASAAFILTFAAMLVGLSLKGGAWVSALGLVQKLRDFAVSGFAMLPMPTTPHLWMVALLIAIIVLISFSQRLLDGTSTREGVLAAYLALLGVGLMSYYNGRSHWQVFVLGGWPFVILAVYVLERSLRRVANKEAADVAVALCMALGIGLVASYAPALYRVSAERLSQATIKSISPLQEDVLFIKANSTPGSAIGVIADQQGPLISESGHPAALEGLVELLTVDDARQYIRVLVDDGPPFLFVSPELLARQEQHLYQKPWLRENFSQVLSAYEVTATGPAGRLVAYRRR